MMKLKKILALLLALTMVFALTACGEKDNADKPAESQKPAETQQQPSESPKPAEEQKKSITVGFAVNDLQDINFSTMANGQKAMLEAMEENLGVEITAYWMDGQRSVETQTGTVENLIALECDAISILPVDTESCDNLFAMCNEAGIPSMLSFFKSNTDKNDYEIHFLDNYQIGEMQGQWLVDYCEANPDVSLKVALQWGQPGVAETMRRGEAVKDVIAKYNKPERLQIVVEGESDNSADIALSLAQSWIQTNPEINCIVGYADNIVWPAIQVFQEAGYDMDEFIVLGQGGNDYNYAIAEGVLDGTIMVADFKQIAWDQFELLCKLALGETRETLGTYKNESMVMIDQSNLDQYYTPEG